MKFCTKCGNEIMDEAVICPKCGCDAGGTKKSESSSELSTVAFVFMIIGTIVSALSLFLIPLAWCLPMTISYKNKLNNGEHVSTAFKVCCLLFVNLIAGILMLCDKD